MAALVVIGAGCTGLHTVSQVLTVSSTATPFSTISSVFVDLSAVQHFAASAVTGTVLHENSVTVRNTKFSYSH